MSAYTSDGEILVETAGAVRRAVAFGLDAMLLLTVVAAVNLGLWPRGPTEDAPAQFNPIDHTVDVIAQRPDALLQGGLLLLSAMLILPILSQVTIGRSPGARVMGIGPIDRRGRAPSVGRTLMRAVARACGGALLGFGWLWALMDPERRTLHDRFAGVWVIRLHGSDSPAQGPAQTSSTLSS